MNIALNRDCMEVMKEYPDGYFDLAVVDPPYGAGFADDGCNGWFKKYKDGLQFVHVERERERRGGQRITSAVRGEKTNGKEWNRFGQRFDRYKHQTAPIPRGKQEPKRPLEPLPQTERLPKKLYRGT